MTEYETRHPEIGKVIGERIGQMSKNAVARMIDFDRFGLSFSAFDLYLSTVRQGYIYGTASIVGVQRYGKRHLERLVALLQVLGFKEDDELIGRIRTVDDRFSYPVEGESNGSGM